VTLESMAIIFRYSAIISAIGILQTLMTLQVILFPSLPASVLPSSPFSYSQSLSFLPLPPTHDD
jgi:hypothetical protein